MTKKIICILLTLGMAVSLPAAAANLEKSPYADVAESDWFFSYVSDLSRDGVIGGYPDGTFRPENPVTCGEALKLIFLAAGYGSQTPANGHWAGGYLNYALSKGIAGAEAVTDLDAPVSRLNIARIAATALCLSDSDGESPFSDISDPKVVSLYESGIVEGTEENGARLFYPDESIKRSEISAIIWRINNQSLAPKQIQCGVYWVDVLKDVPVNSYDPAGFYIKDGVMCYPSDKTQIGIDVSVHQGAIDWQKVKASGIDFAIIRVGYRGYTAGGVYPDDRFESNIRGALDAGIPVGVYFYSQAISVEEAAEEARFVLSRIQNYDITYPVVFDWEALSKKEARTWGISTETLSRCANTFCSLIQEAGYTPMIYFNKYVGYVKYDISKLLDYEFWFAEYSAYPTFYYDFHMWQYTSRGTVPGISGNVDMNIYLKQK